MLQTARARSVASVGFESGAGADRADAVFCANATFFDPILVQNLHGERWQVELKVTGPADREKLAEHSAVSMGEALSNRLIDFVTTPARRWPQSGNERRVSLRTTSNGAQSYLDDPGGQAAPARMNRSNDGAIQGREQDRNAIGGDDPDASPALSGEDDIGSGLLGACPGRLCFKDVDPVNLFGKDCEIRRLATALTKSMLDSTSNENGVA